MQNASNRSHEVLTMPDGPRTSQDAPRATNRGPGLRPGRPGAGPGGRVSTVVCMRHSDQSAVPGVNQQYRTGY